MYIGGLVRKPKKVEFSIDSYPVLFAHVGIGETENLDEAIELERKKISLVLASGANVICDVSMTGQMAYVHKKMLEGFDVPFGTVSAYEAYISAEMHNLNYDPHQVVDLFLEEVKRGFDMITLHATIFRQDRQLINQSNRIISSTSRGGMLVLQLMEKNNFENPYYTYFDEILDIAKKYHIWISLGPCYRPASVADCNTEDQLFQLELQRMQYLVEKALKKGVDITIEGIGHAPLNQIPSMIKKTKERCFQVPYRCMTVSTDIALGYDHISSAIASAVAIYNGADSITAITRSEHIGFPSLEEVVEGVEAAKVAIYSGYIARTGDFTKDIIMSKTREINGCLGHIPSSLLPDKALEMICQKKSKRNRKSCTMCGKYCPLNRLD